ncbi:MAG: peptidoglycan-binding protein [Clostridia bacterium]|nr:peptidoglycan-binding protein [Clostridia bacterium]
MTGDGARYPVIPEMITVHLGEPGGPGANVTVPFPDYIKNVASSEVYPTWSDAALRANILAQTSFALNRVYTEYYRSRGYDYDITNSTARDQAFIYGRDIFDNISRLVDELFDDYISRQGAVEPLFAQYCNGTTVTCDGLSQWGSEALARQGLGAYDILTRYYGNDIDIVRDAPVSGAVESYPGAVLRLGSFGNSVRRIQFSLNRISDNYPAIPKIIYPNGFFDEETEAAVKEFQRIFSLTPDGIVGRATWYKILRIYSGVKSLSDLASEGIPIEDVTNTFPEVLKIGERGSPVVELQYLLSFIAEFVPFIPAPAIDGVFGEETERSLIAFQTYYGMDETGVADDAVWNKLRSVYRGMLESNPNDYYLANEAYYGYPIAAGSEGEFVERVQNYLNYLADYYPSIPRVAVDGIFGPSTEASVKAFQRLFGIDESGAVGALSYNRLYGEYKRLSDG